MTGKELFSKPSDVSSEDGQVLVDGPDGVDVALTPEAAEQTADRLIEHAANAAGQRISKSWTRASGAKRLSPIADIAK